MKGICKDKKRGDWIAYYQNLRIGIKENKRFKSQSEANRQRKIWIKKYGIPIRKKDHAGEMFGSIEVIGDTETNKGTETGQIVVTYNHLTGEYKTYHYSGLLSGNVTGKESGKHKKYFNYVQNNNSSGCPGVSFNKRANRWEAYIKINRHKKHIGLYGNKQDAIDARKAKEKELGIN